VDKDFCSCGVCAANQRAIFVYGEEAAFSFCVLDQLLSRDIMNPNTNRFIAKVVVRCAGVLVTWQFFRRTYATSYRSYLEGERYPLCS